ncbi:uncharacterized protein LOC133711562 [Rosa rugosa]|uniref:uncharacterized protein LOC133711562 n=1 Tax=Rosa rugosa TaxID=74645 RepID=UPI002B401C24|nr:uncharacterized protein LOC133711562 [Rosa rugosa]
MGSTAPGDGISAIFGHCPPEELATNMVAASSSSQDSATFVEKTFANNSKLTADDNLPSHDGEDLVKINSIDVLALCEPRVQFHKARDSLRKLGFSDFRVVEAAGFSGGIWLLWNSSRTQIEFIDDNFQLIYVKVTLPGNSPWMLTVIYASPNHTSRASLWSYLDNLKASTNLPALFIGDFNELVSDADKSSGSLTGRFGGLRSWINQNALIDMGFKGSCYTWSNNSVKERLDRGFCCSHWNKDVFGHLFQRKRRLLARIGGIQKARDRYENHSLINLEAGLIQDYENIRDQENLFWRQKSRDKWLLDGDRNTRFFHLTTLIRRKKNKIEGLFDSHGAWFTDSESMKNISVDFFTDLFSLHNPEDMIALKVSA